MFDHYDGDDDWKVFLNHDYGHDLTISPAFERPLFHNQMIIFMMIMMSTAIVMMIIMTMMTMQKRLLGMSVHIK
jgi:hypothetical protein